MRLVLAIACILPLAACFESQQLAWITEKIREVNHHDVAHAIKSFIAEHYSLEDINPVAPLTDHDSKNIVYDLIKKVIGDMLPKLPTINIPKIGTEEGLYLENLTISGLGSTEFVLTSGKGYDITNLTLDVHDLLVVADRYILKDVDLGIIVLEGDGFLNITLHDLFLQTNLTAKLGPGITIEVTDVPGFHFGLLESIFNLGNLGGTGDAISDLLNGIASQILPIILTGASNDFNLEWNSTIKPIIFTVLLQDILNFILCVARGGEIATCFSDA